MIRGGMVPIDRRDSLTMKSLENRTYVILVPIIWRQRQSPNVLRFIQFDSAVSWLVWIDVHDLGCSTFVREKHANRDFHSYAQCDRSQNQGTMEVDDERLAFARQRLPDTLSLDHNSQTNSGAPSGFARHTALLKWFTVSHRPPQSVTDLPP